MWPAVLTFYLGGIRIKWQTTLPVTAKAFNIPKNLFKLTLSYFIERVCLNVAIKMFLNMRVAILSTNVILFSHHLKVVRCCQIQSKISYLFTTPPGWTIWCYIYSWVFYFFFSRVCIWWYFFKTVDHPTKIGKDEEDDTILKLNYFKYLNNSDERSMTRHLQSEIILENILIKIFDQPSRKRWDDSE